MIIKRHICKGEKRLVPRNREGSEQRSIISYRRVRGDIEIPIVVLVGFVRIGANLERPWRKDGFVAVRIPPLFSISCAMTG